MKNSDPTDDRLALQDDRLDLHHRYVVAAATAATRAKWYASCALALAIVSLIIVMVHA